MPAEETQNKKKESQAMPNWCDNRLTIRGKKKDILAFRKQIEDSAVKNPNKRACLFQTFMPTPKEMLDTISPNTDKEKAKYLIEKYGSADWYDWQIQNWGIKWGCNDLDWEDDKPFKTTEEGVYQISVHYNTPWGPGEECLKAIFEAKENLSFFLFYEEEGMGFAGNLFVKNGITERQEEAQSIAKDIESVW